MSAIMSLQLASNLFTGPIDFLWNTPMLREVDFSQNQLSGASGFAGSEGGRRGRSGAAQ